jgi:hypothetical protein
MIASPKQRLLVFVVAYHAERQPEGGGAFPSVE